jgi:hypothetical protein
MGLFYEKTRGRKSRDTVPLILQAEIFEIAFSNEMPPLMREISL